jgi:hypothetical protein
MNAVTIRGKVTRLLRQRVPIVAWLPEYDREKLVSDFIAGVTVGLTVIPQALAYSTLAGLEPQVIIIISLYCIYVASTCFYNSSLILRFMLVFLLLLILIAFYLYRSARHEHFATLCFFLYPYYQ